MISVSTDRAVSADDFRLAMRQVASSVAVVTASSDGLRNGLTATAVCSVAAAPPTMLVCVNRKSSTEKLISASNAFAINFLSEEQHNVARLFSVSGLASDTRFAEGTWYTLVTGAPVLEDAVASFDCTVEDNHITGTHHVYFGRIVAITSLAREILLYRDGSFRRLAPIE